MNRPNVLTNARFHRRSNAQGLRNPAEVVVHVEQRYHRDVILKLLTEGIRQSGKAPHVHPHVEILSLNVAGADVFGIGRPDNGIASGAKTLRRAVALLSLGIVAKYFDQLRVVNLGSECIRYGGQIHLVAIRGQLDSIRQAAFHVPKELCRTPGVPPSNKPTDNQLGLRFNRGERPNVPADSGFHFLGRNVLFLAATLRMTRS